MDSSIVPSFDPSKIIEDFFASMKASSREAYRRDLSDFMGFLHVRTPGELAKRLFSGGAGQANQTVIEFRSELQKKELAPASINRKLAAIRSFVKFAKIVGIVPWTLEVKGLQVQQLRDTRGPGRNGVNKILAAAMKQDEPRASRDVAIVRLMCDRGLRRGEVAGLDVSDIDFNQGRIWILGKHRSQKEMVTLPTETMDALKRWIGDRKSGAVFCYIDQWGNVSKSNGRLTGQGLWHIVVRLGRLARVDVWPHGIRHTSITEVAEVTNGDIRAVQSFSRHRSADMAIRYIDNMKDVAGEVSKQVARRFGPEQPTLPPPRAA